MMNDERQRWVEAGVKLATDPKQVVMCPSCQQAALEVMDQPLEENRLERHLRCPRCGAYNSIFMHGKPVEGLGWSSESKKSR